MSDKDHFTFLDHLDELRMRVLRMIFIVITFGILSYVFIEPIMSFLTIPSKGKIIKFYFFSPHDAFLIQIKLAIFCGFLFSLPFLFYQTWAFIRPGLFQNEKFKLLILTLTVTVLFFIGAAFCYSIVLPISISFLMGFQKSFLVQMIAFDKYMGFVCMLLFSFGTVFLLPVLVYLLSVLGIVNAGALTVKRGYVLIGILVLSAILTPPDILTQVILAAPMYLLFEISILVMRTIEKGRNTK